MDGSRAAVARLVLASVLLLEALVAAQPGTASSFAEATKRYQNRTREAELAYLLDLREAMKKAMASGDLAGAKRMRRSASRSRKTSKSVVPASARPTRELLPIRSLPPRRFLLPHRLRPLGVQPR